MEIDEEHQMAQEELPPRNGHRQRPKRKSTARRILAISLTSIILLAMSGTLGYTAIYHPYTLHMQATAVAQARADATARVQATIMAMVQATNAAEEHATATALAQHQTAYNEIIAMAPALNDNLSSPDIYNWDTGSGCSFTHNTYSATVTQKGFFLPCLAKKTLFHNFAYQVHMTIVQGDAGGIIVRADPTTSQAYLFVVGIDGTYSIYYYPGNSKQKAHTLMDGYSNQIITGTNKENTLGVIASGTSLDFYINQQYVTSIIDASRSSGLIGILANNYSNTTITTYTHAQVWDLH
jgi:hypothetical protein